MLHAEAVLVAHRQIVVHFVKPVMLATVIGATSGCAVAKLRARVLQLTRC